MPFYNFANLENDNDRENIIVFWPILPPEQILKTNFNINPNGLGGHIMPALFSNCYFYMVWRSEIS